MNMYLFNGEVAGCYLYLLFLFTIDERSLVYVWFLYLWILLDVSCALTFLTIVERSLTYMYLFNGEFGYCYLCFGFFFLTMEERSLTADPDAAATSSGLRSWPRARLRMLSNSGCFSLMSA